MYVVSVDFTSNLRNMSVQTLYSAHIPVVLIELWLQQSNLRLALKVILQMFVNLYQACCKNIFQMHFFNVFEARFCNFKLNTIYLEMSLCMLYCKYVLLGL